VVLCVCPFCPRAVVMSTVAVISSISSADCCEAECLPMSCLRLNVSSEGISVCSAELGFSFYYDIVLCLFLWLWHERLFGVFHVTCTCPNSHSQSFHDWSFWRHFLVVSLIISYLTLSVHVMSLGFLRQLWWKAKWLLGDNVHLLVVKDRQVIFVKI